MKYFSLDIECCGLDPKTCDILEFGAIFDDLKNPQPIDSLPFFHCYFLPINGTYCGEPYALSMHPVIFKRIAEREKPYLYLNPNKFGYLFKKFVISNGIDSENDRVTINCGGKNPSFDIKWLEEKTDMAKHVKIRHRVIDPSIMYLTNEDDRVPGMGEIKKRMGLGDVVAHNALDDAKDVIKMVREKMGHLYI